MSMYGSQRWKERIKINRKIFSMQDVEKIIDMLKHEKYASEIKVSIHMQGDEKILDATPDVLKSVELKSKYIHAIEIKAEIFDSTKKSYEERVECDIDICLSTMYKYSDSNASIESNEEILFTFYKQKINAIINAMKKQAFPCLLDVEALMITTGIVLSLLLTIYFGVRFFIPIDYCMWLFLGAIILSFSLLSYAGNLYPSNEMILGDEYFYPPKKHKAIFKFLIITFIAGPAIDVLIKIIWG